MGTQSTAITYDVLRSIDSSTFTGSYQAVGGPLAHPARIFKFVNNSNVVVAVSIDGINDMDILPASSFALYDIGTNKGVSTSFELPSHTQIYVKSASSGTGLFYVVILYALL